MPIPETLANTSLHSAGLRKARAQIQSSCRSPHWTAPLIVTNGASPGTRSRMAVTYWCHCVTTNCFWSGPISGQSEAQVGEQAHQELGSPCRPLSEPFLSADTGRLWCSVAALVALGTQQGVQSSELEGGSHAPFSEHGIYSEGKGAVITSALS